jgi:SAM-dependent methyltransferase
LWKEDWERNERYRKPEFWDRRAPSFAQHVSESDYSEQFVQILQPKKNWTVIDVGCGAGTMAIPLASRVQSVTAMDFSPAMLGLLRASCHDKGISNVTPVLGSWEDDWNRLGIGRHDVAIASRSMTVEDPRDAIEKLQAAAKERVYVTALVGDGPFDRWMFEALGRELQPRPDYIHTYNILYEMGLYANVCFIPTNRDKEYGSLEAAYESALWMFPDLAKDEEVKLKTFVSEHLILQGSGLRFDYDRVVRWAVISWDTHGR